MVQWSAPSRVRNSGPLLVMIVQVYLSCWTARHRALWPVLMQLLGPCFQRTSTQALPLVMRRLHKARADGCGQAGGVHAGQHRSEERAAT